MKTNKSVLRTYCFNIFLHDILTASEKGVGPCQQALPVFQIYVHINNLCPEQDCASLPERVL